MREAMPERHQVLGPAICASLVLLATSACASEGERSMLVSASAYNSLADQTGPEPSIGAWGDHLEPGMLVIAVSRDLLELGLTHETRVRIEGLPGEYRILDKMAARWTRKIDIYMGVNVGAARAWGLRQVRIHWTPPKGPPR